jgi:hypothetical protein
MASKRALKLVEDEDLSPEDLEELAVLIRGAAEKKRRLSPLDRCRQSLLAVRKKYDAIDIPSGSWKMCESAVRSLSCIEFAPVLDQILALEDVDDRWTVGIEATIAFSSIMFDAEQWGQKLVNGSCGEFCPDLGVLIEEFWRKMIGQPGRPSEEVIRQLKAEELGRCLGDYGDLDFVLNELKAIKVVTHTVDGQTEEKIIYDLISDDDS